MAYPGRQQSYARYESYKENHNEILFMVYTLLTDNEFVANVCKLLLANFR